MTVSIPPRTAEYLLLLAQAEVSRLYWYPETAPVLHERENAAEQVSILSRAIAAVKDESPLFTDLDDASIHDAQSKCVCELKGYPDENPVCGLPFLQEAGYPEDWCSHGERGNTCGHSRACHGAKS